MFWFFAGFVVLALLLGKLRERSPTKHDLSLPPEKKKQSNTGGSAATSSSSGQDTSHSVRLSTSAPRTSEARSSRSRAVDGRWVRPGEFVQIERLNIIEGMFYFGGRLSDSASSYSTEPALIDPSLPIDLRSPARGGEGMSYWPSYSAIPSSCRGAYLEWLSSGRRDPNAYIGYVFLFFYGLERRVLLDRTDHALVRSEVQRLLNIYGTSGSFRGYASELLVYLSLDGLDTLDERMARERLLEHAEVSDTAMSALLSWYSSRSRAIPADLLAIVASRMEDAKRSVVITRSRAELRSLFEKRYQERYPAGFVPQAAVRPTRLEYHPASAGPLRVAGPFGTSVPHVLGRPAQFKPFVQLWNDCIDDLKSFATARKKVGDQAQPLSVDAWEKLPEDLRAEYDHPLQAKWDDRIPRAPRAAHGHRVTAQELIELAGMPQREKYTLAQLRKVAETATDVGYAIEPDPRVVTVGTEPETVFCIWSASNSQPPEVDLWAPVSAVMRLAMQVALADGLASNEESEKVTQLIESLFSLDPVHRERLQALRAVLREAPGKAGAFAKLLVDRYPLEKREGIGRLLVAVSAADGRLTKEEHKALKSLYKQLGLHAAALEGALAAYELSLEEDTPVVVAEGRPSRTGSEVKPPSDQSPTPRLNPKAIEEILKDTQEVAHLLATVFLESDDAATAESSSMVATRATASIASALADSRAEQITEGTMSVPEVDGSAFDGLPAEYHAFLVELVTRDAWSADDVRVLASRHRLMPSAAAETINTWSDEHLGDFLIADDGHWSVRTDLLRSAA